MSLKKDLELKKRERAARIIQKAWKRFLAELLDAAAGIHVRFRFGGVKFPPQIYYKIFTHRPIEDLCANSPRDYTKVPAKYTSHIKGITLQEEDNSGWYHRIENNGWRPVSDSFWLSAEIIGDKKETKFHFSKLKRRQDKEKKRKIRKIEWMKQMYYTGSLEAKSTNDSTLDLIHTATKGLIKAIEDGGIDSVMEWEVDEVLNWTNTLNFDEYIANWKEIATSGSSDNFKPFRFTPAQKKMYRYEDLSDEIGMLHTSYENMFEDQSFTRVTPDYTYEI
ncbi:protein MFI isoform X2 [Erinaceus europaeus]|uniref:Protein MFI isoform X2 n=1 Tax=Erinaceus europaeus TaxID=9365 RepID=A0ABM3WHS1_ERIEU|nr:protein MFI isoform X2 [Erinaceus europaeus]